MINFKDDIALHEVLKQASSYSYKEKNIPKGYVKKERRANWKTGFSSVVIENKNNIIISYTGTNSVIDLYKDSHMARSIIPDQAVEAISLYDKVHRENPNANIIVTGHSLGGSLAQIVAAQRGVKAVTFNAYGVRDMYQPGEDLSEENIVNYINERDPITMSNVENHLGNNFVVPSNDKNFVFSHYIERMEDLSQRKEKTVDELEKEKEILHPVITSAREGISKVDSATDIFIDKSGKVFAKVGGKLVEIKDNVKSKITQCVGSYPVSSYTRADGTEVRGYTRTCGAKHGKN